MQSSNRESAFLLRLLLKKKEEVKQGLVHGWKRFKNIDSMAVIIIDESSTTVKLKRESLTGFREGVAIDVFIRLVLLPQYGYINGQNKPIE